jgi:CBS domain-containing protein
MTEQIARRGLRVPAEYHAGDLDQILVKECCSPHVVALDADDTVEETRSWIASGLSDAQHQGFPVVDAQERLVGLISRRDLFEGNHPPGRELREIMRPRPPVVFEDSTLREAADHMVRQNTGRLPVVARANPRKMIGIITRSDLLTAHGRRLDDVHNATRGLEIIRFPRTMALRGGR